MVKKMSLVLFLVAIFSFVGCLESSPNRITSASSSPSVCSQNCLQNSASSIPIVSQQNLGLWVNGTGKATTIPDVAILMLGVESQQKSVKQAQNDVADAMNSVMSVLNNYGIVDKDIQTSGYNIQQIVIQQAVIYDTPMMEQLPPSIMEGSVSSSSAIFSPYKPQSPQKEIIEYKVSNTINVKIRNVGKTGDIIDKAVSSGGDFIRINGVNFSVDDPIPYYKVAREKAVLYTMEKAKQISQISGSQLGKMIYASESNSYYVSPVSNYARSDMSMGGGGGSTSISSGELEFQVSVEMVYELK